MKHILHLLTGVESYDKLRIIEPTLHLKSELKREGVTVEYYPLQHMTSEIAQGYDLICMHGAFTINCMELLKRHPFVMFADDLLHKIPKGNPATVSTNQKKALDWAFDNAHRIVTTTEQLKKSIGREDKTLVAPNLIDMEHKNNKSHAVLYAGGNSHFQDIQLLGDMQTNRVLFFFCHALPTKMSDFFQNQYGNMMVRPNRKNIGWIELQTSYEKYKAWLSNLDFGVGLCPLVENEFNSCKSVLKVLEYFNQGAISVVSDVMPYSEIPNEAVVKVKNCNWDEAVEYAFGNRKKIYSACADWVFDNYTYNNRSWLDAYLKM